MVAWALFDAALAPFSVLVATIGFSTYFKEVVAQGAREGDFLWGLAASLSMLVVAILAPLLGAYSDRTDTKLAFLTGATVLMVVSTGLLSAVGPGMVLAGILLFVVANLGFQGGQVFYNAFLPEIAESRNLGTVSGFSFAIGYAGALLSLVAALPYYRQTTGDGDLSPAGGLFLAAAIGCAVLAAPTLLMLHRARRPGRGIGRRLDSPGSERSRSRARLSLRDTWRQLRGTLQTIRGHRDAFRFLLAYLVYMDAITTMVAFTAIYGRDTIGLSMSTIVLLFIASELTAIPGSLLFGKVADHAGPKATLSATLGLWVLILLLAFGARSLTTFLIVALLAGAGIGSLQTVSRVLMSRLAPAERQAEFFGFYAVAGRVSAVIGPLLFGAISSATGNQRMAILALLAMIGLAFVLLQRVGSVPAAGRTAAEAWEGGRP